MIDQGQKTVPMLIVFGVAVLSNHRGALGGNR